MRYSFRDFIPLMSIFSIITAFTFLHQWYIEGWQPTKEL